MDSILTAIWMMPMIGLVAIALIPASQVKTIRITSAIFTGLSFVLSLVLYHAYDASLDPQKFQFRQDVPWFPHLNIAYIVGVDGISMPMVVLSGILGLTAALVSFNIKERVKEYYMLFLASVTGVFGVFESLDLFFLVLFYELASIPMYFLVGMWGSERKPKPGQMRITLQYAATKLILYLQLGGGMVFLSAVALYFISPEHTFDFTKIMESFKAHAPADSTQTWLFPLVFIAFGIEAGLVPFHTWLPDGHSSAPTALSMLLAGVLLKMGGYGIIRMGFQLLPAGALHWMPLFGVLGVINIVYGFLNALNQTDIKYLIAYSSVSHMGMVFLGLATFNSLGFSGAVFQMFSHGVITALLFAMAGYIYEKTHTRDIEEHGGLAVRMPYLAAVFALGAFGSLGLPGMSGFVAELLVFFGSWNYSKGLAVVASLTLIYTAAYLLRAVQKIFYGPPNPHYAQIGDAVGVERIPLALLAASTLLVGFWPQLLLNVTNPAVNQILTLYGK